MKEYIQHEVATRMDEKVKKLIRKHGMIGYGIYWSIIEDLYSNGNKLECDYTGLAVDYRVPAEKIQSVVNDFGLFEVNDGIISSHGVEKRLAKRYEVSKSASESARKRWGYDANAMPPHNDRISSVMPSQCDGNAKIKENKIKENKIEDEKNYLVYDDLKNVEDEMLNSPVWIQTVALRLKTDEGRIKSLIPDYCLEQKAKGKLGSVLKEYKSHFFNWARIQLEKTGTIRTEKVYTYKEYCDLCSSGTYTGKDFERVGKGQWKLK